MDGKRFGVGLLGGLLLGLAIIGSTGAAPLASYLPSAADQGGMKGGAVTTTTSTSMVEYTGTVVTSTTNTTGQNQVPGTTFSTSGNQTTTQTTPSDQVVSNAVLAFGNNANSPSEVANIAASPIALGGFVLVPILLAVLLGFLLYRASGSRVPDAETTPEP